MCNLNNLLLKEIVMRVAYTGQDLLRRVINLEWYFFLLYCSSSSSFTSFVNYFAGIGKLFLSASSSREILRFLFFASSNTKG